jgi:hypothetical protein
LNFFKLSIMLNQLVVLVKGGHRKRYKINITRFHISLVILLAFAVSSCVGAERKFPTVTPTPNLTFVPTSTPFPTPTEKPTSTTTLEPTIEPTIEPTRPGPLATARKPLRLGRVETVEEGGFSFRGLSGYDATYQRTQVTLTSEDGDTVVSLIGGRSDRLEDLEADLNHFIEIISVNVVEFNTRSSYQYMIDGVSGLAAEVTGVWGETQVTGRIIIAGPDEDQLFYALAISPDSETGEGWEPQGRQAFEAIISSISFHEPFVDDE